MRILLKVGQSMEVEQWLCDKNIKTDDQPDLKDAEDYVLFARSLIDRGQLESACSILAKLKQAYAEKTLFNRDMLEILALQSISIKALGKENQAIEALDEAINLAKAEGFVRVFVDEGEPMEELLKIYLRKAGGAAKDYSEKLLRAFKVAPAKLSENSVTPSQLNLLVEPLTTREEEVLNLLSAGLSNQEIAKRLFLSKGTIKTHTHNIYGKLGVQSRTQAIARAKELNLL
jgi:LuxR family maltose regulon positive regulatory protein